MTITLEQQPNYRKSGFIYVHRNVRYEGRQHPTFACPKLPENAILDPIENLPFKTICDYDRMFFPAQRDSFLKAWITCDSHVGLVVHQQGSILGLGVIRRCRTGYKVGPLYANNPAIAEALLLSLWQTTTPHSPIYLDVPATNPNAVYLATKYGMQMTFETTRMYNGDGPTIHMENLYGITTFELG